ncbi:MAG: hypothetical protein P8130_04070 [Deltaproteobacteria bacterium]
MARRRENKPQSVRMKRQHLSPMRRNRLWLLLIAFAPLLMPVASGAVEKSPATDQTSPMNKEEMLRQILGPPDTFVYQRENRPDPFLPFIKEKVVQQGKEDVQEKPQEDLPGMQRFEPGQLTLVAIVITKPAPVAMAQDSSGKGYILREGMKIGRTGIIEKITANTVIIKQTTTTWDQEKLSRRVEMVLRKEGEKPL